MWVVANMNCVICCTYIYETRRTKSILSRKVKINVVNTDAFNIYRSYMQTNQTKQPEDTCTVAFLISS